MARQYMTEQPTREEIDTKPGPVVLDFGTDECGFCKDLTPRLKGALRDFPGVQHLKIEDGPGRPLGRSFGVKLWPTLVFLMDGHVLDQKSRPTDDEVLAGLRLIAAADDTDLPANSGGKFGGPKID